MRSPFPRMNRLHKPALSLLLILVFISCAADKQEHTDNSALIEPVPATTAMTVKPVPLMLPFHLDSLFIEDTANYLNAALYFPVCPQAQYKPLNELLLELVRSKTRGFEHGKRSREEAVTVEAWVSEMSMKRQLLSFCFTDQQYTQGAAHYNHGYSCINFDSGKSKLVSLNDLFFLDNEAQKEKFCACVNPAEEGLGPNLLETTDLHDSADFMISGQQLIFCFDDYEKGPSLEKRIFRLDSFRTFLRPGYAWIAEQ